MSDVIANLERLLAAGKDSPALRFGLGSACFAAERHEQAVLHLTVATQVDPGYSAAWKVLGRALAALGRDADACVALHKGIEAAWSHGDKQAEKEMTVFLKRIEKRLPPAA